MNVTAKQKALVQRIIDADDAARIDMVGGYRTMHRIEHGNVYWAALDGGKEYNAVELIVMPVAAFIRKFRDSLEDYDGRWDEDFLLAGTNVPNLSN